MELNLTFTETSQILNLLIERGRTLQNRGEPVLSTAVEDNRNLISKVLKYMEEKHFDEISDVIMTAVQH